MVQANAMDLEVFQFDYDLTFAIFLMNADGAIYGRFGSRSDMHDAERDISLEGLRAALGGALKLHASYPANRAALADKQGEKPRFAVPEEFPALEKYDAKLDYQGAVVKSCIHCHQIRDAERRMLREAGKPLSDKVLYPWPMPSIVGLDLDPKAAAAVRDVTKGSPAATAGFQSGDQIVLLAGQPLLSIADVQWVLHTAKSPAVLPAVVQRDGRAVELQLNLADGWRKSVDIAWRPTTWGLRRMATGGMVLEDLSDEQRAKLKLPEGRLALHVKHVGQYGDHAVAKRAGVLKGDVLIRFDNLTTAARETDVIAHATQNRKVGDQIPITVLRNGREVEMMLQLQ
jgi:hypothetical protein